MAGEQDFVSGFKQDGGSQREAGGVSATESCRPCLKSCVRYPESNGNMARISSL